MTSSSPQPAPLSHGVNVTRRAIEAAAAVNPGRWLTVQDLKAQDPNLDTRFVGADIGELHDRGVVTRYRDPDLGLIVRLDEPSAS